MQNVTCPGCGAPLSFRSSASVLAVCKFCRNTVLKDAASVVSLGKMSEVLEDFSPLQIGTSGKFQQRTFSLIGRIQYRYSDGFWNEWYALFDDGSSGCLSDASGQYAITFRATAGELPLFEKLTPGRPVSLAGRSITTSDVRTARCTAGDGELPFKVGAGWEARVADFRTGDHFMTVDYGAADQPLLYVGQAIELADLSLSLLRDTRRIGETAGQFRGQVTALNCPACGSPVQCVPGITVHIVCPSCRADVDISGAVATVLAAGAAVEAVRFTLALGAEATIDGAKYTVLGAMRRSESDDGSSWSEYFLYAPGRSFVWLVETSAGWQRSEVLNRWPLWDGASRASVDGQSFTKTSEYDARVMFAAGSFNWRVKVGDVVHVNEFAGGRYRLAAEATAEELTWSRSTGVALDQVRAWFGEHVHSAVIPHPTYTATARQAVFLLLVVNAIPMLFAPATCLFYTAAAVVAILLPAAILDRLDERTA